MLDLREAPGSDSEGSEYDVADSDNAIEDGEDLCRRFMIRSGCSHVSESESEDEEIAEIANCNMLQERSSSSCDPEMVKFKLRDPESNEVDKVFFQDYLPTWGYDKEVGKFADDLMSNSGKMVRMQACVGPAIFWAKLAIWVFWPCYIGLTSFGVFSAKCTTAHAHDRIRAAFAMLMIFRLIVEFRCLQFVTIPYVQTLKRFQWMNVTIPFAFWLSITGLLSVTNMLDQLTDSLFVISSSENSACLALPSSAHVEDQKKVNALWKGAMGRFHLPFLAEYHYSDIATFIWACTLLQCLYPLLECSPRPCTEHNTEFTVGATETTFTNLVGKQCNLGDTLYQLADATGMATLAVQQPEYPRMRERLRRTQHTADYKPEQSLKFLQAALSEGMVSVGLIGALENTPQVLLQSFVFAISTAVGDHTSGSFRRQTIVSIVFSCIMCLTKLWKTAVLLAFQHEVRGAINALSRTSKSGTHLKSGFDSISHQAAETNRSIRIYTCVLLFWAMLLIFGVCAALLQVRGSLVCKPGESMWLLGTGCVALEEIAPFVFNRSNGTA